MTTKKHIPHHRRTNRREYHFGPDVQDITCPHCIKTIGEQSMLLMHIELEPMEGIRNIEIILQLRREDNPIVKWFKILHRMIGNIAEHRLRPKQYPYRYQDMKQTKPQGRIRDIKQEQQKRKSRMRHRNKNAEKQHQRRQEEENKGIGRNHRRKQQNQLQKEQGR